jgi:hypothetical protein
MRISEQDYKGWWESPVGSEIRTMLRERIARLCDTALTEPVVRDPIRIAEFLGRKNEINDLLGMSYKELMGEE